MRIRIVKILSVAGNAAQIGPLKGSVPMVYGQQDKLLSDAPGIRQRGNEAAVDHIPLFGIILLFFAKYGIDHGSAFGNGI